MASLESALRKVQAAARVKGHLEPASSVTRRVSDSLADRFGDRTHLVYHRGDVEIIRTATQALLSDLHFEHLGDTADSVVWELYCRAFLDRSENHVPTLVRTHHRELLRSSCFFVVDYLDTTAPLQLGTAQLLPVASPDVPEVIRNRHRETGIPGGAIRVELAGTHSRNMVERGRTDASRALRALRLSLRARGPYIPEQLRFRIGRDFALDELRWGWGMTADMSTYDAVVSPDALRREVTEEIARLERVTGQPAVEPVAIACEWIERAMLADELLPAVLFGFFAMEALLCARSDDRKGALLAARRVRLAAALDEGFPHPSMLLYEYERIRSAAVHGGRPDEVTEETLNRTIKDALEVVDLYLRAHDEIGKAKHSTLIRNLDDHPRRAAADEWLEANAPDVYAAVAGKT